MGTATQKRTPSRPGGPDEPPRTGQFRRLDSSRPDVALFSILSNSTDESE